MLIKNARVIDAFTDEILDVLIKDGKIIEIGKNIKIFDEKTINIKGKCLMPGFVDLHCHFRDPGYIFKEDLKSGSYSALKGGYTTVNLMGNTNPVVDNMYIYEDIIKRGKLLDLINIEQVVNITKNISGNELIDFNSLNQIKFLSDDGKGVMSNDLMYKAMRKAKEKEIGIMVHAEDMDISPYNYRVAEDLITIRDIYLSSITDCHIHFSHVSTEGSINAIRDGKNKGYSITCEVTPHHIYMYDSNYKVNPPIRTKKDINVLIERIKDGTVDCIATDHAPHTEEEKYNGACGMIGLETAFNIIYKVLHLENNISLSKISEIMSLNGAKILGLHNKGRIFTGYDADLVIIDLDKNIIIKSENIKSKSKNSPFIGEKFKGEIVGTMYKGNFKYWKDEFNDSRSFI